MARVSTMLALSGYSPRLASVPLSTYWSSVKPTVSAAFGLAAPVVVVAWLLVLALPQATASNAMARTTATPAVHWQRGRLALRMLGLPLESGHTGERRAVHGF